MRRVVCTLVTVAMVGLAATTASAAGPSRAWLAPTLVSHHPGHHGPHHGGYYGSPYDHHGPVVVRTPIYSVPAIVQPAPCHSTVVRTPIPRLYRPGHNPHRPLTTFGYFGDGLAISIGF